MASLHSFAEILANIRVLHINSTANGGGVAEILRSLVSLSNDLGIDTDWCVMDADEPFFEVTKTMHNGLQGHTTDLTDEMETTYYRTTRQNALALSDEYDIIVLHDPQTVGMARILADRFPDTRLVWRCHIDLTAANEICLETVADNIRQVDHVIFSRPEYSQDIDAPTTIIYPSIDPLSDKNRPLDRDETAAERDRLNSIKFDADSPVVTQVSRFDPWKDQPGTVEAYRQVKEVVPSAQLVLAGSMADDDPEGAEIHRRVSDITSDDPDIHLLTNQPATTINFLQRSSAIILQKSLREGFGLVVSEALWKCTPVIGSTAGGIPLQIKDGENGYLVDREDVKMLAARAKQLLGDDEIRQQLGKRGRDSVREQFLVPRHLLDYLKLFQKIQGQMDEPAKQ